MPLEPAAVITLAFNVFVIGGVIPEGTSVFVKAGLRITDIDVGVQEEMLHLGSVPVTNKRTDPALD